MLLDVGRLCRSNPELMPEGASVEVMYLGIWNCGAKQCQVYHIELARASVGLHIDRYM